MAQDFNSMFGMVSPQDAEAAYLARQQVSPNTMAQLPLLNQVVAMGGNAGAGLGNTVGRMLGGQTSVEAEQALMKNIFSKAAAQSQDPMERQKIAAAEFDSIDPAKAQALRNEAAKFEEQRNKSAKAKTDAASATYKASQEAKLRAELQALPPNATEDQYLEVVRKYGSPDNVMRSMETRLQKQQALEAKQAEVTQRIEADLQRARENNASREDLARIAAEGRREIAQLMSDTRREIAANKPPSPAVLKREDAKVAKAEGKASLDDTVARAEKIVEDLTAGGGMTSTKKGGISNMITSLQASGLGQTLGSIVGTNSQALRDQYSSLRLQLLNDVKSATGMSATQMNSNVELQTWLSSLVRRE